MTLSDLPSAWRTRAENLERYAAPAAAAFRTAADELEETIRSADEEKLTLAVASTESGYAARTLREKLAKGEIPNAGQKHRPRIRRGDLPRRVPGEAGVFDPAAHVADLIAGVS